MEITCLVTGGCAILGYMRAHYLYNKEKRAEENAFGVVKSGKMMESV